MRIRPTTWAALFALALVGCAPEATEGQPLRVFAAASTHEVIRLISSSYEEATGVTVKVNAASSSVLARQIEHGASADIFLSADIRWMDHLQRVGRIKSADRDNFLTNRLVIASPTESRFAFDGGSDADLARAFDGHWVMGDPDHVPVGRYGKKALQSAGWWSGLSSRLVPALDAAASANLLAMGEMQMGVLYATDALSTKSIHILADIPASLHGPIIYPIASIGHSKAARNFMGFLREPEQIAHFQAHGFGVVEDQQK